MNIGANENAGGPRQRHFRSIQTLRAVAAISVVLFHEKVFNIGYGGVDLFFVISGFIMGTIGVDEPPVVFVAHRLIRIVPLYWAATIGLCLLSFIPGAFRTFTFDPESLAKSLLFIPYRDHLGKVWPLEIAGWTLNYEVFFYGVFAVGLFFKRAVLFSIVVLGTLVIAGSLLKSQNPLVYTYTNAMMLEFVAGLALARFRQISGSWLGAGLLAAGFVLFIRADLSPLDDSEGFSRLAVLGLPAVWMVMGAICLERAGRWPRLRFLEAIGDASYSLYLLHGFLVSLFNKYLHLPASLMVAMVLASSLLIAWLSYRLFERPLGRLLRNIYPRSWPANVGH